MEINRHDRTWTQPFCYGSFAAFFLGIYLHQIIYIAFAIMQLYAAARKGIGPAPLFTKGRHAGAAFTIVTILGTVITYYAWPITEAGRLHWAISAFWAIGLSLLPRIDWKLLHRLMLAASVPGLCYSVYWLLQPDEIAHAMKIGFHYYPRASGLLTNAIVHAEGLVILAGWSLARLERGLAPKERGWITLHLILSVTVVLFSRVRSGLLGFCVLFLVHALLTPRFRKAGIAAVIAIVTLFALTTGLFGFNIASIDERAGLIQENLVLLQENPWFGIGPNKFGMNIEGQGLVPKHPHNTVFGVAVEFGLIGLTAYLVFMAVLLSQLRRLQRFHRGSGEMAWVTRALGYALMTWWVFGLTDYNLAATGQLLFHGLHWSLIAGLAIRLRFRTQSVGLAPTPFRLFFRGG